MNVHVVVKKRPYAEGKAGVYMGKVVEYPNCIGYGDTEEEMMSDIKKSVKKFIEQDETPEDEKPSVILLILA